MEQAKKNVGDYEDKIEAYRRKIREDYARRRAILERRRHTRIDARVPVMFETANDYVQAYTHNLSKGGLYFETPERLSPNGRLELVLSPPGSDDQVKVIARVVRMITRYQEMGDGTRVRMNGYGVRFEKLPDKEAELLESYFEELSKEVEGANGEDATAEKKDAAADASAAEDDSAVAKDDARDDTADAKPEAEEA